MGNDLIPPAGMDPSTPHHLTPDQRVAVWADLMDASEQLLLAGLSRQICPDGDLREAYRRWYVRQMEDHDRALRDLADNLFRRGVRHGR
jgi:hypothetical protein